MMLSQEMMLEILEKIQLGEFSILHITQKSFRVFGVRDGEIFEYTNQLAFLDKFSPLENETLLEFENRIAESKIAKNWNYKEKITMRGEGYCYAAHFLAGIANSLSKLQGLKQFKPKGDARFNRL